MTHTLRLLLIMFLAAPLAASAATLTFETPTDLAGFTTVTTSGNFTVTQDATAGAGNPATGGVKAFGNTSGTDRGSTSYRALSVAPSLVPVFETSILANLREFNTTTKDKAEVRLGYTTNTTTSVSKAWEFFPKQNPGISLVLKAEHDVSGGKSNQFEVEIINRTAPDVGNAPSKITVTNSIHFDDWVRLKLRIETIAANTYKITYFLESLGTDGTSAPVTILATSTPVVVTNATFAAASTLYEAFSLKTEKSLATAIYLDDLTSTATPAPPAQPLAQDATAVYANGFTAHWTPGSGLGPQSWRVEVKENSSDFSTGPFVQANGTSANTGITLPSAATRSLTFAGLTTLSTYSYRVIGINTVGDSPPSNVINATLPDRNAPPGMNALANVGPIPSYASLITVPLTGINAGGEPGQQVVSITASSSNTGVIPHPTVTFTPGSATGTLTFDPVGFEGSATVTVTLNDGQAEYNTTSYTFDVLVIDPLPNVAFETPTTLSENFNLISTNLSTTHSANGGAAGTGGIRLATATPNSESGILFIRNQTYPLAGVTEIISSLKFNYREIDDVVLTSNMERKGEIRLGLSPTNNTSTGRPDEYFNKQNYAIHVKVKGEHKLGVTRTLEVEVESRSTAGENKGAKITLPNASQFDDWLQLDFKVIPIGGNDFLATYTLFSLGLDGNATPQELMKSVPFLITNPDFAAASQLYAGFAARVEKNTPSEGILIDDHSVLVSAQPADIPDAYPATHITSTSFRANWLPGDGAFASGYVLEVVAGAATEFTLGNFLSATGTPGQTVGITISGNSIHHRRVSGLNSSSVYRYRLRGINLNGLSNPSEIITLTTLPHGANSLPTLNAIPDSVPFAENAGLQTIQLTGITDGGEQTQTVTVTAQSSNTALIPTVQVNHTSPNETGTLTFTPALGAVGNAEITVTVTDSGSSPNSFSQTFTVFVIAPEPVLAFDTAADLESKLGKHLETGTSATWEADAGIGSPPGGGVALASSSSGVERILLGVRPTAYDANSAGYLVTSMLVNFGEIDGAPTKDGGELRLGFMSDSTPFIGRLNDTMHKLHPSLGVKFKLEQEPTIGGVERQLEVGLFSGPSDNKAGELQLNQDFNITHWYKVTLVAVRQGLASYGMSYVLEDFGPDGSASIGIVAASNTFTYTVPAFASDTSVFAAFILKGNKEGGGPDGSRLYFDQHETYVNTTAPFSPTTEEPEELDYNLATLRWTPSPLGRDPQGYYIEMVPAGAAFAPGNFISQTGQLGQPEGFWLNNPAAVGVPVTGLTELTTYRYRVSAYTLGTGGISDDSFPKNSVTFTTPDRPLFIGVDGTIMSWENIGLHDREVFVQGFDTFSPAVLKPGALLVVSGIETLTIGQTLALNAHSEVRIELGQTNYTKLATHTLLPVHETARFVVSLQPSYQPQGGEVFDIFDWNTKAITGDLDWSDNLVLPDLPTGLTWDTSLFTDSGIIRINGGTPTTLAIIAFSDSASVLPGNPVTFNVTVTGTGPWIYQWTKNGTDIPGANFNSLRIAAASESDEGDYAVRISNGTTTVTSNPAATLNVYDPPVITDEPDSLTVNPSTSVSFTVAATSEFGDLQYEWRLNGSPINSAPNAPTYTLPSAQKIHEGTYTVAVSNPAGTTLSAQAVLSVNNPVIITSQPQSIATITGQNVQFNVAATGTGTLSYQWQFEGQDLDGETTDTLQVIATTDTIGRYRVRVSNIAGHLWSLSASLTLEGAFIGKFTAPLSRHPVLNANLGGKLDLTTTTRNAFTGRVTLGTASHPFKGTLNLDPLDPTHATGTAEIKRGKNPPLNLTFTLGQDTIDNATITLPSTSDTLALRGWRNVWNSQTNPPTALAGYHTLGFNIPTSPNELRPEGIGHATFTVNAKTGTLSVAGRLADGTAFTSATFSGPHGEILVFRTLYTAKARGSVIGTLQIATAAENQNNTVSGEISWLRPAAPGRVYPLGFGPFDLEAVGARYSPPDTNTLVMGIDTTNPTANNAALVVAGAGIEGKLVANDEVPVRVDIKHRAYPDPAFATNRVSVKINPKTGLVTGSFRVSEPHPFPVNAAKISTLTRTVTYRALLIKDATGISAQGLFMLPQLPTAISQKISTIPILSGQVTFEKR